MSLGDLLEGMALHCFDGKASFSRETLAKIKKLKEVYELDLTAKESHQLKETGVMTNNADSQLQRRFERLEFEPGAFRHNDHVQAAYAMLGRYDFVDACVRYASTLRAMAESAGVPEKYNATITIAFLSLIAERRSQSDSCDLGSFLASNPDLLEKVC